MPDTVKTNNQTQPIRVLRLIARLNVGGPARHVASLMTGLNPAEFSQTLVAGRVRACAAAPWQSLKEIK